MNEFLLSVKERVSGRPRILLTDTNRWPVVMRMAIDEPLHPWPERSLAVAAG